MRFLLPSLLGSLLLSGPAAAAFVPVAPLSEKQITSFKAPQWVIDPAKTYRAVIGTTKGDITVEFYPQKAPKAVNSFVFLALNHFYDGTPFHRVLQGFMAQGGDPTGTGTGSPGYSFYVELDDTLNFNSAGVLGMARAQSLSSQGSQFFITLAPAPFLNGQYTVFGKVVEGQKVVDALQKIDPQNPDPAIKPDRIQSVQVLVETPDAK
ncbi:peptidylprolyl isomerase [Deinococcus irradiatisoli]|uniref:Peptidyl-prolyl cis-trans isomerase n=1 Tax=Deinococcus irradiatisoli TaxID=2202254 RepID=A0A2Z3JEW9_9DEIO|nr:peptidylprolyl isomerase [Deinococcus irradiatisoli]AWN23703.1 peptidylprolyl isomerase [Deinococcus irradiatisoli]